MGTWGTGPLDSDNALDYLHALAVSASPEQAELLLRGALGMLALYDPNHTIDYSADPLIEAAQTNGITACAVVAMKLTGRYLWGYTPAGDEPEDFALERIPPVATDLRESAIRAVAVARRLATHPDVPAWRDPADSREHGAHLAELAEYLNASTP